MMEPDEKKKFYEDEKEKLEIQSQIKSEKNKTDTKKAAKGCLGLFVLLLVIAYIAGVFDNDNSTSETINFSEIRVCFTDGVNIRTGPGIDFEIDESGKLFKGEKIYITKNEGEWIRFVVNPANDEWQGWVKKEFTISKEKWDLELFSSKINNLQKELGIQLVENISVSNNKATITVSNLWHIRNKQLRLQDAQTLWKLWADINNPSKPDEARIKLVDFNGNDVGGSGNLAGSIIKVKD